MDKIAAFARRRKEAADEQRHGLIVVRAGEIVAWVDHTEMGDLVEAAKLVAGGYGAGALGIVVQAVSPLVETNPVTGAAWQSGEADEVWREHDGAAKRWVTECLVIEVLTREGEHAACSQPFVTTTDGIEWTGDPLAIEGAGLSRVLGEALAAPVINPAEIPDPGDLIVAPEGAPFMSAEAGRVFLDVGLTRSLDRRFYQEVPSGSVAIVVADSEAYDERRSQGLEAWQVIVDG